MALFQYKTASAGTWTNVPQTAYHGTYDGTFEVQYPESQTKTGVGRPCAAIGDPKIFLQSKNMTASGMSFWQSFFATNDLQDVEFWLTARDPRSNTWLKYTGWLLRPKYSRIQVGSGSANTMYFDVEITLDLLRETT